ncbi:MAG: toll/interleukin-1 receptor domain-containing protein [Bryobacteraceae bacterium]|jgi:hypothetical protein
MTSNSPVASYIPIITRASLASPWCSEEISAALALCNRPTRGKQLRIIPVLAEDCPDEMPPSFLSRLCFNFAGRYTEALRDLLHKGFGIDSAPRARRKCAPDRGRLPRPGSVAGPLARQGSRSRIRRAAPHMYTMSSLLTTYGNPQFGIRPGNLAEALKAYRAMAAEANAGAGWSSDLLQAAQEQTFLPKEMSQSLTRLITRARDQVHLLKTELAKLGDI